MKESYIGSIAKIRTKGLMKEGIFQPREGQSFRFRARALPSIKQEIIVQGNFTPDRVFVVSRYYLTSRLTDLLPKEFMARHKKAMHVVSKHLGNENIVILLKHPELLDQWLGRENPAATQIKHYVKHHYTFPNLLNYFHRFALSRKKISEIYNKWGIRALDIVESNPYSLAEVYSVPFQVADTLAREKGIPFYSPERVNGAIRYVYLQYLNSGNSYLTLQEFTNRVYYLLGKKIPKETIRLGIEQYAESEAKQIVRSGQMVFDRHLYFAEIQIAQRLADLTSWQSKQPKNLLQIISTLMQEGKLPQLDQEQIAAMEAFFIHPILLVQGEAGTGKTGWISYLLTVLKEMVPNVTVKLSAPTGKAARRITAITGYPAQTIHSLLGKGIEKNSRILYHHKKNPLNTDVLIVDEASMVNEYLWRDILWAVERGTKIVFVGDPNQLEPIGPGRPFAEMIQLGFPTVTLLQNYRNDSAILALAKAILHEEVDLALFAKPGIKHIPSETIEDTKEKLASIYAEKQGKFPIVSMYREEFSLGVDQLNPYIKQRINPDASELGMGKNDPVIQMRNTAKVDNGEVGVIQECRTSRGARICFEQAKEVDYTPEELLDQVELAYAITTTKTQGSQYEGVILPLVDINRELEHRHSMWYKNSLYTAITRAQKELILIGDLQEMIDGVKRKGVMRRTQFSKRIEKVLGKCKVSQDTAEPYQEGS